jgi:hypothetical protein
MHLYVARMTGFRTELISLFIVVNDSVQFKGRHFPQSSEFACPAKTDRVSAQLAFRSSASADI